MGLDMFLTKKTYIGAYFEHRKVKGIVEIDEDGERIPIQFKRISYIEERVGYWRKANAIHQWFVENCQEGVDDCREAYVEFDQLIELLDICREVKANHGKAYSLLPVQSGPFFGSTDYDDWYWEDIDTTIEILENLIAEPTYKSSIYYSSSW